MCEVTVALVIGVVLLLPVTELYPTGTSQLLAADTKHNVTVTNRAKDKVAKGLTRKKVWTFTTGAS